MTMSHRTRAPIYTGPSLWHMVDHIIMTSKISWSLCACVIMAVSVCMYVWLLTSRSSLWWGNFSTAPQRHPTAIPAWWTNIPAWGLIPSYMYYHDQWCTLFPFEHLKHSGLLRRRLFHSSVTIAWCWLKSIWGFVKAVQLWSGPGWSFAIRRPTVADRHQLTVWV